MIIFIIFEIKDDLDIYEFFRINKNLNKLDFFFFIIIFIYINFK
jgi:hypothetical protein